MRKLLLFLALTACTRGGPRLDAVGPREVSNQSSYPITIYGSALTPGLKLRLELDRPIDVETAFLDTEHLAARLPAGLQLPADVPSQRVPVRLVGASGESWLKVVNDTGFPTPYDLAVSQNGTAFVAVPSTDEVWVLPESGAAYALAVGDGPRALAIWHDGAAEKLVVAHEEEPALLIVSVAAPRGPSRRIVLAGGAQDLAIDDTMARAYVTNHRRDVVDIVDLRGGTLVSSPAVGVNPRSVAVGGGVIVVGNKSGGDISLLDPATGVERRVAPTKNTRIVGGPTEAFAGRIVGGKAARAIVVSHSLGVAFVASIGPNIGPNEERMEVSMNGGIGVIELAPLRFVRHVTLGRGVPQDLAYDERRRLLYAADVASGRLVVLAADKLVASDDAARSAVLASLEIEPPDGTPFVRDAKELGVKGRAGTALHSGPWALALSGTRLWVLSRFTGVVTDVDATDPLRPTVRATRRLPNMGAQAQRRAGEVLYFTDMGNSRMTCDTCHNEGHDEGILFTKTSPMHFYRSPSLRGISETPPYFTPSKLPSLASTAEVVLARNRYHNPNPTRAEIQALAAYQDALTPLPNPYAGASGVPPDVLTLPDGRTGRPANGRALFAKKCTSCHPPPQFTGDQDGATRARFYDVGTPITLNIRQEFQDTERYPLPAPSLVGIWDEFPLLHSGAAGLSVTGDDQASPTSPFALRRVFEIADSKLHGEIDTLPASELNDLLAYLLTL